MMTMTMTMTMMTLMAMTRGNQCPRLDLKMIMTMIHNHLMIIPGGGETGEGASEGESWWWPAEEERRVLPTKKVITIII